MSTEPYWLRLEFPPQAITIVRDALRTKLYRGNEQERLAKLLALNQRLSAHYEVSVCKVTVQSTPIGPHYLPGQDRIILDKISLVSWAHEFAHHILHCRHLPQTESFPRAFGLGIFFRAAPRMFEAARQSGRLLFTAEGDQHAQ